MTTLPTGAQQRAAAYAHIPFAIISAISSSYIIYHLIWKERNKLNRLYHRLVLSMNFALLPLSIVWILLPYAVPSGTPYFPAASGSIQTCTASGFFFLLLSLAVPIYYSSLSLQALLSLKNNFKEEKYVWVEKYIHFTAWGIPCAIATVYAATENYNPFVGGAGCFVAKVPFECELNPDVPCQRGKDTNGFELVLAFILILIYLVFTPSVLIAIYCGIGKLQKKMSESRGMQRIRETAKRQMMKSTAAQISAYLLTFLLTWIFGFIVILYFYMNEKQLYNLDILNNCLNTIQGFAFAAVYFSLQRIGGPKVENIIRSPSPKTGLTVEDIRSNVEKKSENVSDSDDDANENYAFNIFDGAPDDNSPWAKYILDDDDCSSNADNPDA